jgi:hypothetical protein
MEDSTSERSTYGYSKYACDRMFQRVHLFPHLGLCGVEWGLESGSSNFPSSLVMSSAERSAE